MCCNFCQVYNISLILQHYFALFFEGAFFIRGHLLFINILSHNIYYVYKNILKKRDDVK